MKIRKKEEKCVHKFVNTDYYSYLCTQNDKRIMVVTFEEDYLRELYENGQASEKKHRFQPQIIKKYTRIVDLMMEEANVMGLNKYGGLHYEHLHGDKEGLSSVKVNNQYRIEFREILEGDKTIAEMVSLTELSNHYKKT
jgi:proteic killer suppression protein